MKGPLDTTFERFFETKTAADVEGTMTFFSTDLATTRQLELERKAALIGADFA